MCVRLRAWDHSAGPWEYSDSRKLFLVTQPTPLPFNPHSAFINH